MSSNVKMKPFHEMKHGQVLDVDEIQVHTRFAYMFPLLAEDPESLLPPGATTQGALLSLGTAIATDDLTQANDSGIPAVFTYLGQFIDHDITAQTDREIGFSRIATPDGSVMDLNPILSQVVTAELINGRRPELDLDSLYGDGPSLGTGASPAEADPLYNAAKLLKTVAVPPGFDVPRESDGTAIVADMRNNENLNVSQLHCTFLLFHDKVAANLPPALTDEQRYIRARQLVRWAYQYVVVHDYLRKVCDPVVVDDVLANGLRYYSPDYDEIFMPLEFSIAAFRFGHSMIRPEYKINAGTTLTLAQVLDVKSRLTGGKLDPANVIEWHNFIHIPGKPAPQMARKIDPLIARDLGNLPFTLPGSATIGAGPLLQQLARRNLLRGFLLSIPTGQAIAGAMGIAPLSPADLVKNVTADVARALFAGNFDRATPLWYYLLQEASVQQNGQRLGSVGSRIVAETLIGLVVRHRSSYLNELRDPAVKPDGIEVATNVVIKKLADVIKFAGVPL